jgi:hypothetical protein
MPFQFFSKATYVTRVRAHSARDDIFDAFSKNSASMIPLSTDESEPVQARARATRLHFRLLCRQRPRPDGQPHASSRVDLLTLAPASMLALALPWFVTCARVRVVIASPVETRR